MKTVQMGKRYFKLDNTTETREPLMQFFKNNGFEILNEDEVRPLKMRTTEGLEITLIWYKNLSHIRIGKIGDVLLEFNFDEIRGASLPWNGHDVYEFFYNDNAIARFAIARK